MFSFFRKKPVDARDTEQLIFDIAEHNRGSDFDLLYVRMRDESVFMPVDCSTIPQRAIPGERFTLSTGDQLMAGTVALPPLGDCVTAATNVTSPVLSEGFVEIEWREFLVVAQRAPEIAGALLQGVHSWVAFDMDRIRHILDTCG